jgi:hypothetical protein
MRINLVTTGATYSPVKISQKPKVGSDPKVIGEPRLNAPAKGVETLLDGLTPQEATALQKLFGDFKPGKESIKNSRPGQFIDITV